MNEDFLKEGLFKRAVRGGFWVFLLRIIQQGFHFVRLVILARILAPYDFGLMGIALLTMATLETFSQTGFQAALIQKKNNAEAYLNSAWTIMIIRGIVLFMILYFSAPYATLFFRAQQAKAVIQIIGFSFLIQAFTNIGTIYFQKELQFNKQFIYQLLGTLADFFVAVSAALLLRSVWALVFGLLAGNIARLIGSYCLHPYRPRISLDLETVKELFGFGKWVLGSSILVFLIMQGDDIFVVKLLGATALGFYQMADRISNMPATEITHVISQVTFPTYSKLQDSIPKLREAYLKVLQLTAFLAFPMAGFIFVLAPDFTKIFLGEKWRPMVPAMQILVFAGLARSIAATAGYMFYAVGRPRIDTLWQIVRLLVLAGLIYPFTAKWGIVGSSIAVFLSIFLSNIGFSYMAIRITRCDMGDFSKMIAVPLVSGVIAVLIISGLKTLLGAGIWEFIILGCSGALAYLFVAYLSDKFFGYMMQPLLRDGLRALRGV